jgi:predicted Zn finger-like uncharacterized protein
MAIQTSCPSCGHTLRVKDDLIGKRVRCPECGKAFSVEEEPHEDDDRRSSDEQPEERASTRGRRADLAPHRGTMVLVLGICSLGAMLIFPLAIAGIVCGIIAWIFGHKDLARIKNREMDPEGEGPTKAGMICGMIGTIVCGLIVVAQIVVLLLWGFAFMSCCCIGGTGAGMHGGR